MYTYLKKLAEGAPPSLGPVERWLDSGARGLFGADSAAYKHYTANRNLWNIALPAIGVGATSLMANAAQNAFSGGNNRQGGGSSPWTWLLPLGIIGGGLWAWNKYGDRIMSFGKKVEGLPDKIESTRKKIDTATENANRLVDRGHAELSKAKKFVAYNADKVRQQFAQGGAPASDAYRQEQILGKEPVYNPKTGKLEYLQQRMTPSAEAVRQSDPTHMARVHDAARNSVYKEDGGPTWKDRLAQKIVGFFG